METKEEKLKRKLELAEIKENAWKWRGKKSSHEEHTRRKEIEAKNIEEKKVRDRIANIENQKKIAEEKKKERMKMFLINKKENN